MVRYIVAPGEQFRNETELGDAKARKALRSVEIDMNRPVKAFDTILTRS
jgi:hypothetical protein